MIYINPPADYSDHQDLTPIFLAGSIEMGVAVDWQAEVVSALKDLRVLILNPRRSDWDATWVQSIHNPNFRGQVEWELKGLDDAGIILFYFAPETKAPITLLELGIHAATTPKKLIVCCPDGFWRKGNVDIVCTKYGVEQVASLSELVSTVRKRILTR